MLKMSSSLEYLLKFILLNNYYVYVMEHEITIKFYISINYIYIQGVKKFRIQTLRVCRGDKMKPFCYVTNI